MVVGVVPLSNCATRVDIAVVGASAGFIAPRTATAAAATATAATAATATAADGLRRALQLGGGAGATAG